MMDKLAPLRRHNIKNELPAISQILQDIFFSHTPHPARRFLPGKIGVKPKSICPPPPISICRIYAAGGEKVPGRFHISVPKTKEGIWNLWSNAQKNKGRRSEQIIRLIEKEIEENFDDYHE